MSGSDRQDQHLENLLRETGRAHGEGLSLPADADTALRRQLEAGFARRRRRRRNWAVGAAACVVLVVSLVGFQTDVGSDGFSVQLREQGESSRSRFETTFTKDHYGSPRNPSLSMEERINVVERVHETVMADAKKIVRVTGYTLDGETFFIVDHSVEVDGEYYVYNNFFPENRSEAQVQRGNDFFAQLLMPMMDRIDEGLAPPLPDEIRRVDGQDYVFHKWTDTRPGWGEVIYWQAVLPD